MFVNTSTHEESYIIGEVLNTITHVESHFLLLLDFGDDSDRARARVCACASCVCVCVCFHILPYVNCFGRTVLYLRIEYCI